MPDGGTRAVVVVGAGLAGLAAALEAADTLKEGAGPPPPVLVLEGQARTGGNSAKASSGVSAVATPGDAAAVAAFEADLVASAGRTVGVDGLPATAAPSPRRAAALRTLAAASPDALAWLGAKSGVDMTSRPPARLGGHSTARTYGPPGGAPVGAAVMGGLAKAVEGLGAWVEVRTGARVVGLVVAGPDGAERVVKLGDAPGAGAPATVVGVVVEGRDGGDATTIRSRAVVLTTGGFGASPRLLAEFAPAAAGLPTTNGPWAAGEGVGLGRAAGAAVADMALVQVHPTAFLPSSDDGTAPASSSSSSSSAFLAPERLRGVGGILLNARGERFADELARRDVLAAAVRSQPGGTAWLVLSQAAVDAYGAGAIAFYESKGLMSRVEGGVGGLARAVGAPESAVAAALADHDAAAAADSADAVGRSSHAAGPFGATGPFHVGRVGPAVHYTMGGLAIDGACRVLDGSGQPVRGLYAAGEVTGGVHGSNRLGGCSLLECVVFGRTAGKSAAEGG